MPQTIRDTADTERLNVLREIVEMLRQAGEPGRDSTLFVHHISRATLDTVAAWARAGGYAVRDRRRASEQHLAAAGHHDRRPHDDRR